MDLRSKLAKEFAQTAYKVFESAPTAMMPDEVIEKAAVAILERFTSHSIPFPRGDWVSTYDEGVVTAFLSKYPALQELIDLAKAEALRRWPEATFQFEVRSDPDECHTCQEPQFLAMNIHTGLAVYGEAGEVEGSPHDVAEQEWMGWICAADSPFGVAAGGIGTVANLFFPNLAWDLE